MKTRCNLVNVSGRLLVTFDRVKAEMLLCYHYPLPFFADMFHYPF